MQPLTTGQTIQNQAPDHSKPPRSPQAGGKPAACLVAVPLAPATLQHTPLLTATLTLRTHQVIFLTAGSGKGQKCYIAVNTQLRCKRTAVEEVLHGDQATTLQTDRRNERVQQTRQADCHQPPLQKGWKETNALDDTPDWANCTLSGHSTSTCRCVRPLAAPPMLPTKSTTGRTVADSA
jgi:hypothetical protein